jgi:SpoVK/Ycf46/Vps4 family AAA+-type ATPase
MKFPFVYNQTVRRVLRTSTDVLGKLPSRGDGPITTVVKFFSIYESVLKHMGVSEGTSIQSIIGDLGGVESWVNRHFVQLFFSTAIKDQFQVKRLMVGEYTDLVIAEHPEYGRLFFVEWKWGPTPEHSDRLWASQDFDFKRLMDQVWGLFQQTLHVDFRETSSGDLTAHYSVVGWREFELMGEMVDRFDRFLDQHRRYQRDGVSRTYLFKGPQGVGKTTFALRATKALGGRVLRLSATSLTHIKANELDFLLDNLSPDYFLVDDIDKVDLKEVLAKLLTVLAEFKMKRPALVTFLTANQVPFDPAFMRPERIDEILEFRAPDAQERYALMRRLSPAFIPDATVRCLARGSEGLTIPYLKEIALQLQYRSPYEVNGILWRMTQDFKGVSPTRGSDPKESTPS